MPVTGVERFSVWTRMKIANKTTAKLGSHDRNVRTAILQYLPRAVTPSAPLRSASFVGGLYLFCGSGARVFTISSSFRANGAVRYQRTFSRQPLRWFMSMVWMTVTPGWG